MPKNKVSWYRVTGLEFHPREGGEGGHRLLGSGLLAADVLMLAAMVQEFESRRMTDWRVARDVLEKFLPAGHESMYDPNNERVRSGRHYCVDVSGPETLYTIAVVRGG